MAGEEEVERRRRITLPMRRPRWSTVLAGFLLVVLLLFVIIWTQRRQLATDYIRGELERRGVEATYRVTRIGFRTERIEDVVIGDPKRPDLTAKWVEIKISWGLRRPQISMIKARGVRMVGRIQNKKISFGQVDKLLPPPSGKPFEFPDLNVDLADAAIMLATPAGKIGLAVEGKGNLANGFAGEMAMRSAGLMLGKCRLEQPSAYARVAVVKRRPSIDGPFRGDRLLCAKEGVDLANPVLDLKANVSETLNAWRGSAGLNIQRARLGANQAAGVSGRITFDGKKKLTRGAMNLSAVQAQIGDFTSARTLLGGRYALSLDNGDISLVGNMKGQNVVSGKATIGPVLSALAATEGTPVGPLGAALATAVRRAAGGFDLQGTLRLVNRKRYGAVRFERAGLTSRSGANLGLDGGEGITYYWPSATARIDGEFGLTGGGFPATRLSLSQQGGNAPIQGTAIVAPYAAGNARIALAPIRFRATRGGATHVDTAAVLSGPFDNGYVRNLALPISGSFGRGGFAFGERCITASFDSLQASSLQIGRTRLPLCPTGRALIWKNGNGPVQGGTELRSLRLAGRLGQTPIAMTAARMRLALGEKAFNGSGVAIRLGQGSYVNQLDLDRLDGRITAQGVAGNFAGGRGRLANVPLLLSRASGRWRVVNGEVTVDGGLTVADAVDPPRFWPLASNDFHLTLVNNQIRANGWLYDPETGTRVTQATISHSLPTGTGQAVLDVPGITFQTDGYQPEELTRLTTGVVALVDGTLTGRGQINWSRNGTTSTGSFSTVDMDLAAPFGPIEGLTTTINFTDLLGLQSAPGQLAQINLIRTGIDVVDGQIRYQLLPGLKVRVESGRWPFAGGILTLDETILDFSQPSTKKLTFHVVGLDAATFIQEMKFTNIDATGTFDGILPMEFDQNGGRIVGGRLEARAPGGTLSYVGIVSENAIGGYQMMAFNALKSLRYDKFIIKLDGSLEGEFLAGIELDGIARNTGPQKGIAGYVIGQLQKLRFEFNIAIRGPFRALIATARSLDDPSQIIQPVLPAEYQDLPVEVIEQDKKQEETVKPQESEIVQ